MNRGRVGVITRPVVVAGSRAWQAGGDFAALAEAIDAKYGVAAGAERHFGAGRGTGAGILYGYAAGTEARMAALYLFDGNMEVAAAPCAGTYYYIDTTDEGEHFVASGELYERCKADGVPYDYRVRNGLTGAESSMGGFLAAKSNLMDRIKN